MTFRRTRCPQCKAKLEPGLRIHPDCIDAYAEAMAAKKEREDAKRATAAAKVERAEMKHRREAVKTIPMLIDEAQFAFNAFIRERDHGKPCICCGRPLGAADVGGGFDCGHYRSRGSAPHLRFDERNAHGQTKACNRYGAGRAVDYRIGLIARIGREAVEALESENRVHKWQRDELIAIRKTYQDKLKTLRRERNEA